MMLLRTLLLAILAWSGACHAQFGGALTLPCEVNGPYLTVLATKACTASYQTGTKAAFDVVVYDSAGAQVGGTTTINYLNGAMDTASVVALFGTQQLGTGTSALPILGNYQRQVYVTKWYSQNGGPDAIVIPGDDPVLNYPVLRVFGPDVHVGFGNAADTNDQRRLKLSGSVALNTQATTVLVVGDQYVTNAVNGISPIFYTSENGTSGIGIIRPQGQSTNADAPGDTTWRTVLLSTSDQAEVKSHVDVQVMTIASGPAGGELGNDLGTATFGAVTSTTGSGFTIGCRSVTTTDGSCHHGDLLLLAVKSAYSAPDVTANMRLTASIFFGLPLALSRPNVVIDGDSGIYGWANFYPGISGTNQGSEGNGPSQQIPAGLKKRVTTSNLAHGGSTFPNGFLPRAGRYRRLYRPEASINIAIALSSFVPTSDVLAANLQAVVDWAAALRSTGQTWTLFVGNANGGTGATPCSTADSVAWDAALRGIAAANSFTVVNNLNAGQAGSCYAPVYGLANTYSPAPLGHVYSFISWLNMTQPGGAISSINAVLP